eukprot:jgi/Bigna1/85285/estExt_fgenesh1_pg.C_30147
MAAAAAAGAAGAAGKWAARRIRASLTSCWKPKTPRVQRQRRSISSSGIKALPINFRIALDGKDLPAGSGIPSSTSNKLPLVVVHGLLGSGPNMRQFTLNPSISGDRPVVRVDLRNHGLSPHSDVMSTEAMAHDLIQLLDDLNLEEALFLDDHADPGTSLRGITDSMAALDLSLINTRKDAMERLAVRIPNPAICGFVLMNLEKSKDGGWQWKCNLEVLRRSLNKWDNFATMIDHGSSYSGPTLFVKGGRSAYIQPENAQHMDAIQTLFPGYEIETIKDAGHWIHAEKPKEFVQVAESFLNKID